MLSKLTGIVVLALSVGVFLAPKADAKTFKGTFHSRGTAVSMGGSFSFDTADTTSTAALGTGSGTSIFPKKPILGGAYSFQSVSEYSEGTTSCSFTGVFGESETGVNLDFIGSASAVDGPLGSTFYGGASGSGCINLTSGEFTVTETDTLFAGTGIYKGATGSSTYTEVGFTLAPPAGGLGFFQWAEANGKTSVTLP